MYSTQYLQNADYIRYFIVFSNLPIIYWFENSLSILSLIWQSSNTHFQFKAIETFSLCSKLTYPNLVANWFHTNTKHLVEWMMRTNKWVFSSISLNQPLRPLFFTTRSKFWRPTLPVSRCRGRWTTPPTCGHTALPKSEQEALLAAARTSA